jgi:2-methylcitrate dehydratase PrpD
VTGASEQLAAFAVALDPARVEPSLVQKAKDHFLDTIGVACTGIGEPQTRAVTAVVRRWGGTAEAGVVGLDLRLPAPKAAFLNALHARIHTFDDAHEAGPSHPSAAVVAGALAAAEAAYAPGRALLAALLAGYEAATRLSAALGPGHYGAGFHSTGTCSPIGAVVAASRARGFDAPRIVAAIGLAGEAAVGIRQYQIDGSMLDSALNGARGAELGVAAAEMAAGGVSGPRGVLDGRLGLLRVMSGSAVDALTADLGRRWEFAATALKPYASCRFTHGPVAALRAAKLDHRQVDAIEIVTFRASVDVADRPNPQTRTEAILSHQLAAALALLGRPILPRDLDTIDDSARTLAARVRVRHDPELDSQYPGRWPHRIAVLLRDGSRVTLESVTPPVADSAQARAKFKALAGPVLGPARADQVVAVVDRLETLPDLASLLQLLRPGLAEAA